MRLYETPCPSSGAVRTVELQDAAQTVVVADSLEHRAVLTDAGLPKRLPDLQHAPDLCGDIALQQGRDRVLREAGLMDAFRLEPVLQLCGAVRVAESGDLSGLVLQLLTVVRIIIDDVPDQLTVQLHAVVVHILVEAPQLLLVLGRLVDGESLQDLLFGYDILPVVGPVQGPLLRVMCRIVPAALPVASRRLARLREVLDERLALRVLQLILRKPEGHAYACETSRKPERQRLDHRAAPLVRRHRTAGPLREAGALEVCIKCGLDDVRVKQRIQELVPCLARIRGRVDLPDLILIVELVADQQDVKVRGLHVSVDPGLEKIHRAVCLDIYAHYSVHHLSPL